jgi:Domain of unknown function (DUF4326)
MNKPIRYQRSRKEGSRLPAGVLCVTRTGTKGNPYGRWGNPFDSAEEFEKVLKLIIANKFNPDHSSIPEDKIIQMRNIAGNLREIQGRDLACWCPFEKQCHADVLIDLANRPHRLLDVP